MHSGSGNPFVNKPAAFANSEEERLRKANPALMVLTHPQLEAWHKDAIRKSLVEYSIGVIFVPLFEDATASEELPVLRPLDPRMVSGFTSFDALRAASGLGADAKYGHGKPADLQEEILLNIDTEGSIEEIIEEVVAGVKNIMSA